MKNEATDFKQKQWEIKFKKILKCHHWMLQNNMM